MRWKLNVKEGNNIKNQVYAQKLVGAHKKLQQADSEPFQVKLFVRFKHQEFHGLNRTNQNFIYCSWSNPEGCLEIFIIAYLLWIWSTNPGGSIHPWSAGQWDWCSKVSFHDDDDDDDYVGVDNDDDDKDIDFHGDGVGDGTSGAGKYISMFPQQQQQQPIWEKTLTLICHLLSSKALRYYKTKRWRNF